MKKLTLTHKLIIAAILGAIIVYLVNRIRGNKGAMFTPADPEASNSENVETGGLSEARKTQIQNTAYLIYNDIYETPWTGHDYTPYNTALGYNTNELIYMGDYYEHNLAGGNKISDDMYWEGYSTPYFAIWGTLMHRLANLGH